jgi:pimeloyl-ACP methyl ester carboxylesterase
VGNGPGLILVPGALAVAADLDALALELAQNFTVHTIERRGRGLSGPQGKDYSIKKECEDIVALQNATDAIYMVGHSFGGFVALEAARNNKSFKKIAAYEPGVSIDGSIPLDWVSKCQEQIDKKHYLDAFTTFARGVNPESAGKAPHWLLRLILPIAMKKKERRQKYELLAGTIREHSESGRLNNTYDNYREISAGTLLMTGKQNESLKNTTTKLSQVLPQAKVLSFPTFDHFGPEKKPREIAREVIAYFLAKN